jgi:hypothetical protein
MLSMLAGTTKLFSPEPWNTAFPSLVICDPGSNVTSQRFQQLEKQPFPMYITVLGILRHFTWHAENA